MHMTPEKTPFDPEARLDEIENKARLTLKSVVEVGRTLQTLRNDLDAFAAKPLVRLVDALTSRMAGLDTKMQLMLKSVVEVGRTLNILRDEVLFVIERPADVDDAAAGDPADGPVMRDYLAAADIREIYPTDLFPGLERVSLPVGAINEESGHFNQVDLLYVAAIAKLKALRRMFEFGTYQGRTTYHLAQARDDAKVWTLNLPPADDPSVAEFIGCWFRGSDRESQVEQLFCNSFDFDPAPFAASMDLVFVDGDHSYAAVKNDTEKAFRMLAPGGVLAWHDFAAKSPGVVRYLCELSRSRPLFRLKHTCLVVYLDGVDVHAHTPGPRRLSWVSRPDG